VLPCCLACLGWRIPWRLLHRNVPSSVHRLTVRRTIKVRHPGPPSQIPFPSSGTGQPTTPDTLLCCSLRLLHSSINYRSVSIGLLPRHCRSCLNCTHLPQPISTSGSPLPLISLYPRRTTPSAPGRHSWRATNISNKRYSQPRKVDDRSSTKPEVIEE
jgi:hypothetical protein